MGLFTKNPIQASSTAPLYTLGGQSTLLIVALGNPGKEYEGSRHNIGFACADDFIAKHSEFSGWVTKKDQFCNVTSATLGSNRVIIIKPTTFMNDSGRAVQAVQNFYKISNSQTLVVHDELDILFGQIRARQGGGTAGHNGLKSIVSHSGEDFTRIRIGINNDHRTKSEEKDFVLKSFSSEEQKQLPNLYTEVNSLITEYVYGGQLSADTRSFII